MEAKDVSQGQALFMNLKPGDHLCCLYETEEEHREIITPFLRQGLERGEKVIYIVDAHTADTVLGYLRDDGVDVETFLARGQLSIVTRDEAYLRGGVFDPDAMIAFLRSTMEIALAEGYPAIRASGEMTWALRGLPGSERLIEYESKLNHFFPGSKFSALCQYDRRRFDPAILLDVIHTHPIVLIGTKSYDNFYFTPPDIFLGNRPAARLQQLIQSLDERKRAEEILRENEERYRSLFEQSIDAILLTAPDGRILAANSEACRIFGRTEAEICQVGRAGLVDVTDPRLAAALEERARTGKFRGELTFVRKDGTKFPGEVATAVYRDRHGDLRTSMTLRDITVRKRAEEEQRTATLRLTTLIENMQTGILFEDDARRVALVNQTFCELFGIPAPAHTLIGADCRQAAQSSKLLMIDPEGFVQRIDTIVAEHQVVSNEELRLVDGRTFERNYVSVTIGDQQLGHLWQYRDITNRKRMEATMHTRLRISEFADSQSLDELLQKTLDEAETLTGSQIGFYHFVDADQRTLHLQIWSTNTLQHMCTAEGKGRHYDVDQAGVWVDCVYTRKPVIHNDYASLTHRKGMPEGHAPVVRELVVPVLRGDLIVAILGVGNKPTDYDAKDIEIISQLANLAWDSVQRKRTEAALRESEEKYRQLFELELDALFLIDNVTGEILEVNASAVSLYGYSREELLRMRNTDLSAQPDETRRAMAEKHTLIPTRFHRKKDGTVFPVEITASHLTWQGRQAHIAAIRDITARMEAEAARRESEERFRLAFQYNAAGMTLTGADGRFLQVNQALCKMLGYSEEELLAKTFQDVTYPGDRAVSADLFQQVLTGEREYAELEKRYVRKDGTLVWILITSSLVHDVEGKPLYFVTQMQDITERKQVEEQLRYISTHDALTDLYNRAYFEAEMERLDHSRQFPVSVVMLDVDGLKATNDLLGHSAGDDLLRRTAVVLKTVFRAEDIIARVGGDEFAVLLPKTDDATVAEAMTRARNAVAAYNRIHGDLPLSFSMGAATAHAEKELIAAFTRADQLMYREKALK